MAPVHQVAVAGTHVEVEELGAGEPAVVVQTALSVHEHAPLSRELSTDFHVWHVHRPGYGASGPVRTGGSIEADADLVEAVVRRLGLGPTHLVGASYSAAVVLSVASRHSAVARSVTLVEPPPYGTPSAAEFRSAMEGIREVYSRSGAGDALDDVMRIVDGPEWRTNAERDLPGSVADMERDAGTFFGSDIPSLLRWRFDDADGAGIRAPALLVGGGESSPWFGQMLDRLERVLVDTTRVTIAGAGHAAALTHPAEVAAAVREHVRSVSPGTRAGGGQGDRS